VCELAWRYHLRSWGVEVDCHGGNAMSVMWVETAIDVSNRDHPIPEVLGG
jgi:hypothetical protein